MVFGLKKLHDDVFCLTEERDYFQSKYTEQVSVIQALQGELKSAKREIVRLRQELMQTSASVAGMSANSSSPPFVDQVSTLTTDDMTSVLSPPQHDDPLSPGAKSTKSARSTANGKVVLSTPNLDLGKADTVRAKNNGKAHRVAEDEGDDESSCLTDDHENGDSGAKDGDSDDDSNDNDDDGQDSDSDNDEDEDKNEEEDTEAQDIRQSAEKLLQWAQYRTTRRSSGLPDMVGLSTSSVLSGGSTHTRNTYASDFLEEKKEDSDANRQPSVGAKDGTEVNLTEQFNEVA
mmetsp:Transcript_13032/g.35956  ORF Transcript_13032/g.35956 Transcript_13032/m.35956 type:complete len:289 (-) Transcript_13032:141-1007(-)|eukprot:CAMPEP_0198119562 /NCGR_PEP_ID=MMETSP1442-20131203/26070_1 /TAXON_ID= /ORGANISM="Craspedostauros australis, Strain CCMP3328" /LENGTH=288 /DNA_ID=CAMNT_0043778065 /DNA_START=339 /DNA_END=1205 /DNA_ORIENTATION=+